MENKQSKQEGQEGEDSIGEQIKQIFKKEGLSWQKLSELTQDTDRSSLRKKVIGWLENASRTLDLIGYEIIIKKKEKNN